MRARIADSIALIRAADPELASEIDVLGRQLVLAEGDAGTLKFSGASTFFLWGALVLNPKTNGDALTLAETLAHESGHALLFGLCDAPARRLYLHRFRTAVRDRTFRGCRYFSSSLAGAEPPAPSTHH